MSAFVAAVCAILVAGAMFVTFVVMSAFGPNLQRNWNTGPLPQNVQEPVAAAPIPVVLAPAPTPAPERPPGYVTMQEKADRARAAADERRRQYWEHREWEKRLTICKGC